MVEWPGLLMIKRNMQGGEGSRYGRERETEVDKVRKRIQVARTFSTLLTPIRMLCTE